MTTPTTIRGFAGEMVEPGHATYDAIARSGTRWSIGGRRSSPAARRPTTSRRRSATAATTGLEIAVKCGGHGVLGLSVPEGGLMIDLSPMGEVSVDPGAAAGHGPGWRPPADARPRDPPHGLATTAGNVSHTGVGGLTLGGGMGWLARQSGLACDNVEAYTVVTADGETVRATATENPDLFWGLRGGGGNFGVVTEFEFRLHPTTGRCARRRSLLRSVRSRRAAALRAWRDLLPDAPRPATLTSDTMTVAEPPFLPQRLHGRPVVTAGFVWVGDMADARAYLDDLPSRDPLAGRREVDEMRYVDLQSSGDERHVHGLRRYSAGHYLTEFSDAAIDAFLARGVPAGGPEPDWSLMPGGGFQAYGGAIADVGDEESAFSHRNTLIEFFAGSTWADPAEDAVRMAGARTWAATLEPFSSGTYVNVMADADADVSRGYHDRAAGPAGRPQAEVRPGQRLPPEPEHQAVR